MPWFPYKPAVSGHLPGVEVHLVRNGRRSITIPCLVDSGASISQVSIGYVRSLTMDLGGVEEQDTGAKDANNQPVKGIPLEFDVEIPGLPSTSERIWVSRSDAYWALLGQTWFEKFGVRFENFPLGPSKRRFALHLNPWPAPPPAAPNPAAAEARGPPLK